MIQISSQLQKLSAYLGTILFLFGLFVILYSNNITLDIKITILGIIYTPFLGFLLFAISRSYDIFYEKNDGVFVLKNIFYGKTFRVSPNDILRINKQSNNPLSNTFLFDFMYLNKKKRVAFVLNRQFEKYFSGYLGDKSA